MSAPSPIRLAVVLSHPVQYYSPWFRRLAAEPELRLRVFYLWDFGVTEQRDPGFGAVFKWDIDLLAGHDHEFVPNSAARPGTDHFWGLRNPALPRRLAAWRPDAVLMFGYAYASHLRAIIWARWRGIPLIFRGDSHFIGRPAGRTWRTLAQRWIYAQFSALTFVGQANRDYFTALGVPTRRLFFAPHAVDETFFDPANPGHRTQAVRLREQLGISASTRVVLFAGKFVPAKQPRELLEAFLEVNQPGTALVLAGDGVESPALRERARSAAPGQVHFLPFANQSEMPARYLLADVFALPSRGLYETWGLAVNEAMHLGVPCLVSDRVGCQRDLVTDNETGWVFRAEDAAQLRERLRAALAADLAPFRTRVSARIANYTYRQATAGLLDAVRHVIPRPVRST
ncbi:MAG: glycosyl transferase [Verrucomicrobia bacterium]|nr:glycosyl transferase [Verrucomicrobiota bacterium]